MANDAGLSGSIEWGAQLPRIPGTLSEPCFLAAWLARSSAVFGLLQVPLVFHAGVATCTIRLRLFASVQHQ